MEQTNVREATARETTARETTIEELGLLVDNELRLYNEAFQKVRENLDTATREEVLELVNTLFDRKERYCKLRHSLIERTLDNTNKAKEVAK